MPNIFNMAPWEPLQQFWGLCYDLPTKSIEINFTMNALLTNENWPLQFPWCRILSATTFKGGV